MVHLIVPMAGRGSRFADERFRVPKPLIDLAGQPFFFWATRAILTDMPVASLTYVVLREHIDAFDIGRRIKDHFPRANVVALPEVTKGAVITCLAGAEMTPRDGAPLIFQDCDHAFRCAALRPALERGLGRNAGLLLSFRSTDPHFSFIRPGEDGAVIETVEKRAVSTHAIAGAYVIRDRSTFEKYVPLYVDECPYPELFTSGIYNTMLRRGERVGFLDLDWHLPFGIVAEYEAAQHDARLEQLRAKPADIEPVEGSAGLGCNAS